MPHPSKALKRTAFSQQAISGALLLIMLLTTVGLAGAEQVLKSPKRGVEVQLKNDVKQVNVKPGDPFSAQLGDTLRYKEWSLPAGTEFRGVVTESSPSHLFGRPGYVGMEVHEAVLPDGRTFEFDPAKYKSRNYRLHHPETYTFPELVLTQIPYSATSLGVTIPLYYAGGVGAGPCVIIGTGVRMLTGSVAAFFMPHFKHEPPARKVALGALDGSGVTRIVGFLGKYPVPDFHTGDTVKVYFNPDGLKDLFQSTGSASLQTQAKLQAASAGNEAAPTDNIPTAMPTTP